MAYTRNRSDTLDRIALRAMEDVITLARRDRPPGTPDDLPAIPDPRGIDRAATVALIDRFLDRERHRLREIFRRHLPARLKQTPHAECDRRTDPGDSACDPFAIRSRTLEDIDSSDRVRTIYDRIRRTLWRDRDFLSLNPKARAILETVIELARDEGFPWFVAVQAREIMRLVRLNHASMANSLRELEMFTLSRPARMIRLFDNPRIRIPNWNRIARAATEQGDPPPAPVAQFVVRYRRGCPIGSYRAAWWLNYDLLCGTGRLLPCFAFTIDNLPRTYENRNRPIGARANRSRRVSGSKGLEALLRAPDADDPDFRALERALALRGPRPPLGLRAALWEGIA